MNKRLLHHLKASLHRFHRDESALAMMEFAFILPILLILALPLLNYISYIITVQKVNKTASTLADMIVMSIPADATTTDQMANDNKLILSNQSLQMVLDSSKALMQPYDFPAQGKTCTNASVRVDSVIKTTGNPAGTYWSATYSGKGSTVQVTNNASPAATPATLDASFVSGMYDGENVIIVEVTCGFTPPIVFSNALDAPQLSPTTLTTSFRYPARNGALTFVYNN